jgi:hypothetical protein
MTTYPAYIERLLAQAREEGQWYSGQADAAGLCFEVLALFPDHHEASELVYELFCDEWLIYDNRTALQRHIDEWDDRPWQQRRRLALSFRFMSRWPGWERDADRSYERERAGPADVADLLEQGRSYLLHSYCLGDNEGGNLAWEKFTEAFEKSQDLQGTLRWVGKQYADLGLFADAAEVLSDYCARFDDESGRRLLAEVRWWRDNAHRLPWIPPAGDGSRYKRMMAKIDPNAPDDEEVLRRFRSKAGRWQAAVKPPDLDPELSNLITEAVTSLEKEAVPKTSPVDWSFLDEDDGQPGELPEWAQKMMRRFPPEIAADIAQRHRWSRPIKPPSTPPRYDPNEPPFEPWLEDEDEDDWAEWAGWDDE